MNSIIKIPNHKTERKSYFSKPDWPGILPCRFKGSKMLFNPPSTKSFQSNHDITNDHSIFRPQKRFIFLQPHKKVEFRPSSKYVPQIHQLKHQANQIYPQGDKWSYSFRSNDNKPLRLKEHKFYFIQETKNKIISEIKQKKDNNNMMMHKIALKEKKMKNNPLINQLFKSLSDHEMIFQYNLKICNDDKPKKQNRIINKSMSMILKNFQYYINDQSNDFNIKFPSIKNK